MLFRDRHDAGRKLVEKLQEYQGQTDVLVLALPRGGVPVGFELARCLCAPLDVFIVRKLGVPGREELAMGAIASGGIVVLNLKLIDYLQLSKSIISRVEEAEGKELARRELLYRRGRRPYVMRNKKIILVDDGLATGASMRAAVIAVKRADPGKLIVAVPVAAKETCIEFKDEVDEIICFATPEPFRAVGSWYEDFSQTSDEEVRHLLEVADLNWKVA